MQKLEPSLQKLCKISDNEPWPHGTYDTHPTAQE